MRTHNAVIAALLGLGLLAPAPALAQAPDLGPDWELVGSRKVKTWVAHPTNPGDGTWELVDYNTYRIFQENLSNPAPGMPAIPAPVIQKGPVKKGKPFDEKKGIERVRKGLLVHKYQTIVNVTPQTQTEILIKKGWILSEFTRVETRSRALRTKYGLYDISFQVPVTNYRWDDIETGRDQREVTLDPIRVSRVVELLPPDRTSEISSLAKADGDRPGVFRGDAGSGGKASLSASKLRQQLGANHVKASEVTLTPEQVTQAKQKADEQARQQAEAAQAHQKALEQVVETFNQNVATLRTEINERAQGLEARISPLGEPSRKDLSKKYDAIKKEINEKYEALKKEYDRKYAEAQKDPKKLDDFRKGVDEKLTDLSKVAESKFGDLDKLVAEAQTKQVTPQSVFDAIQADGDVETGEQNLSGNKSVKAYYSRKSGRWVIYGFNSKNGKGVGDLLYHGINLPPAKSNKLTLKDFKYQGKELTFYLSKTVLGWDPIISEADD